MLCKWCYTRGLRRGSYRFRDGPVDHWFCTEECGRKWVKYRHVIGVAHVVKMPSGVRTEYLKGKTIDEFISDLESDNGCSAEPTN